MKNNLKRIKKKHKEIYLKFSDDKKELKNIIRFFKNKGFKNCNFIILMYNY